MGSRNAGTLDRPRGNQVEPTSSEFRVPGPSTGSTPAQPARTPRSVARRRPAALLVALVVGGLAAGLIGGQSVTSVADDTVPVAELLGSDAEGMLETEISPQLAITEVEARARLAEVAANRAQRQAEQQAADAAAVEAAEAARPDVVAPVENARMTTCFCMRWGTMHYGIDLAAPMLTPEYAVEEGVVLRAGAASGFGLAVYILGVSGDVTVYGHMEKIQVSAGDVVSAGDQIALLGSRGQSTGPHLHFEVHSGGVDGKRIDPVKWLRERGVDL